MSFWKQLFNRKKPSPEPAAEPEPHCVTITIKIPGSEPSQEDWDWVFALQDEIDLALKQSGTGELDGDLWGQGECTIYCYSTNAEAMWKVIKPVIEPHPIPKGSFATKQFGGPDCGREERVNIDWAG
jgi:hypothetical protein